MRVLSLFSGIGGMDLGFHWAGHDISLQVESDPFCRSVLSSRFPGVPCHNDVRTLNEEHIPHPIDIIIGGFPCQDISVSGRGAGLSGPNSSLWNEMHRIISFVRPPWVVIENSPALRVRGADLLLSQMEELGYTCWPLVVGAVHASSPHIRKRVFIVAHSNKDGFSVPPTDLELGLLPKEQKGEQRERLTSTTPPDSSSGRRRDRQISDTGGEGLEGHLISSREKEVTQLGSFLSSLGGGFPALAGQRQLPHEKKRLLKSGVGGATDGVPSRLDTTLVKQRLSALGNACVPQVAYLIADAIDHIERASIINQPLAASQECKELHA